MYEKEEVFDGDREVVAYRVRKARASERADIMDIEHQLRQKQEAEANKLFRLAWAMKRHGCSKESIERCRQEARWLHSSGRTWDILNPFVVWEYAFKF